MVLDPATYCSIDPLESEPTKLPQAIAQPSDTEPADRHSSDFHDFFLGATETQIRGGLEGKHGWLNWRLAKHHSFSFGPRQPHHPTYLSGDKISGTVVIGAERPKIASIRIQLTGRLISTWRRVWSRANVIQFLDYEHLVWPNDGALSRTQEGKRGKTQEVLHFAFDFPPQIDLATFKANRSGKKIKDAPVFSCTLPPTVKEPNATVEYLLSLVVDHGRFRSPSSIDIPIVYILKTVPPSPLRLRTLAYQEGKPPPPPSIDPEGWHKEGPLRVHGVAPREREEDITFDYTLYLSQPLFYTCGTTIPCHLRIACGDQTILHLLSSPEAHAVRLLCRLKVCDEKSALASYVQTQQPSKPPPENPLSTRLHQNTPPSETVPSGWRFSERSVGMCTFWEHREPKGEYQGDSKSTTSAASSKGSSSASKKSRRSAKWPAVTFDGELHLDRGLLPSFDSGVISIEYFVQVLPFADSIFDSKSPEGTEDEERLLSSEPSRKTSSASHRLQQPPLVSIPIQIGTMRPPGPRQVMATPPSD